LAISNGTPASSKGASEIAKDRPAYGFNVENAPGKLSRDIESLSDKKGNLPAFVVSFIGAPVARSADN
jgi:hypothetical protein